MTKEVSSNLNTYYKNGVFIFLGWSIAPPLGSTAGWMILPRSIRETFNLYVRALFKLTNLFMPPFFRRIKHRGD
jgi:hypothetical protein